jgi:hypothetical protein
MPRPQPASGPVTFLFVKRKPETVSAAGDFAPVKGCVRLHGRGAVLRLFAEGNCLTGPMRSTWRVEAVRTAWFGEFIERPPRSK